MQDIKKLEKLEDCEGFADALADVNNVKELQMLFRKHKVELTKEDLISLIELSSIHSSKELSESDLNIVVGGNVLGWVFEQICTWFTKKGLDKLWNG